MTKPIFQPPAGTLDPTDPFCFDLDGVAALACERTVRLGVRAHRDKCVVEIELEDGNLTAQVQTPQHVTETVLVRPAPHGRLWVDCSCLPEVEPVCWHTVAALLTWSAKKVEIDAKQVRDRQRQRCEQAGRSEVRVRPVTGDDGTVAATPWRGDWQAWSMPSTAAALAPYRVRLRSRDHRVNDCTCHEFLHGELGTCRHVEAVRHHLREVPPPPQPLPPLAVVYLDWDGPKPPELRLHREGRLPAEVADVLAQHFGPGGHTLGPLPAAWQRLREAVADLPLVEVSAAARRWLDRPEEEARERARQAVVRLQVLAGGTEVPGLRATLHPFQVEGVAFLAARGRALLGDTMGLGKTLQAIAATSWLVHRGEVRRAVVVCPTSLCHQWLREIRRFSSLSAAIVRGPQPHRHALYHSDAQVLILTYERTKTDQSVLTEMRPDLLILDEAQKFKNHQAQISAVIKALPSRFAFVLTGTPLENRLEELHSLLQVVDPWLFGPLWRFRLEQGGDDSAWPIRHLNDPEAFRQRLRPVLLGRDRAQARIELPPKRNERRLVPMTARQRQLHEASVRRAGMIARIEEERPLSVLEEKALLGALNEARMAACAAGLREPSEEGSPKLDALVAALDELCGKEQRKVVVFSQWTRLGEMAAERCADQGLGVLRLHGGLDPGARARLLQRFEDDPRAQVLVSSDVGGTGLNLQCASAVVHLELPWNPAVLAQRTARVHRLGQHRDVRSIEIVAKDSYESRLSGLLWQKRHLFDQVMGRPRQAQANGPIPGPMRRALWETLRGLDDPLPSPHLAPRALP